LRQPQGRRTPGLSASILPPFSDNDSTSVFMRIGDPNPGPAAPGIDDFRAIVVDRP
jgi:hypothetical protein